MALDDMIRRAEKQLFEVAGLAAETSFVEMVRGPGWQRRRHHRYLTATGFSPPSGTGSPHPADPVSDNER